MRSTSLAGPRPRPTSRTGPVTDGRPRDPSGSLEGSRESIPSVHFGEHGGFPVVVVKKYHYVPPVKVLGFVATVKYRSQSDLLKDVLLGTVLPGPSKEMFELRRHSPVPAVQGVQTRRTRVL